MIVEATIDPNTGAFSVGSGAPDGETQATPYGQFGLMGILYKPPLIHTVTRQQRRHAERQSRKRRTAA